MTGQLDVVRRWELVVLRIGLASVMWPHGAQKAFGWFGGYGVAGTQEYFTETLGMPWLLGAFVIAIELLGPVLLLAGAATRLVAAGFVAVMVGAISVGGHARHGFFMNWFGNQAGEGFEFHLLMITGAVVLILAGGGPVSVDGAVRGAHRP
jgi:putative oxidoreductase